MLKPLLEPGKEYRLNELAEIVGKTRTTIDRYIERFQLKVTTTIYMGKTVQAVILTEQNIDQILNLNQVIEKTTSNVQSTEVITGDNPEQPYSYNMSSPTFKQGYNPFEHVETLREKLHQSELERVTLQERLKGVENELKRADEQIDLLRQTNKSLEQTLQATLILEGQNRQKSINLVPEGLLDNKTAQKKSFFDKIKAVFKE